MTVVELVYCCLRQPHLRRFVVVSVLAAAAHVADNQFPPRRSVARRSTLSLSSSILRHPPVGRAASTAPGPVHAPALPTACPSVGVRRALLLSRVGRPSCTQRACRFRRWPCLITTQLHAKSARLIRCCMLAGGRLPECRRTTIVSAPPMSRRRRPPTIERARKRVERAVSEGGRHEPATCRCLWLALISRAP